MATFKELGVHKNLCKGLTDLGITTPTTIQQEVIPVLLHQTIHLVGQAPTGTGKTAAFGLPLLQQINPAKAHVQALVLCPTRELGQQIAKQFFKFTKYTDKIFTEAVFGGAQIEKQMQALKRPTHIVVATPGRLIDLVRRKAVSLQHVQTIVLDEADEMLSMGFKKSLETILEWVPQAENKWLFSATMPSGIRQIISHYLSPNAHKVVLAPGKVVNKNIVHQYVVCKEYEKTEVLLQFLKRRKQDRGIIFCKTKEATQKLAQQLHAGSFAVAALQGDLKQKERDKIMRGFKNERLQFIIATDLAARGIDVHDLRFVVHYQLPATDEYYTHRSGRTARAGKDGLSICLVTTSEIKQLRYFERTLGISFSQVPRIR